MNKFEVRDLNLYYGQFPCPEGRSAWTSRRRRVTAFIGPSGCGKSTFLKTLNRMNDLVEGCRITGDVKLDGVDIFKDKLDVNVLRKRVGMVFQKANPFPMSIYDNIAYGPRTHGIRSKSAAGRDRRAVAAGRRHLGRGQGPAEKVGPGHVRRPAAAPVHRPRPGRGAGGPADGRAHFRALDPISTSRVEELALDLKKDYTIVIVTHNMQQAARISDKTAFFLLGELVEMGPTERLFATPSDKRTEDYISGRFG